MKTALDFSDVLASSVHDIKNSLAMAMNILDSLVADPETRIGDKGKLNALQKEAQRANNNLIQLLSLYKLEKQQLSPNIGEVNVDEFLEELLAENSTLVQTMGITVDIDCDDMLTGYFDENLIRGVLNSTLGNAERYTRSRILLSAAEEGGYLVIRIEDDGDGYPGHMLQSTRGKTTSDAFSSGHTQLGLVFAAAIAELHTAGDRTGHIALRNGHELSGGCFELWLP